MEFENIPVYTIYVKPRNKRYANYIINDSAYHTKSYEDLQDYLISLLPEKNIQICELLACKKTFVIFLQEREIKELSFDLQKEMEDMKYKMKFEDLSLIEAGKKHLNSKNYSFTGEIQKESFSDSAIRSLSKIDISKSFFKK
jgi:hypothetical protein